mmetsp:Transcript_14101/g.2259  ORF Transcript_14101/g.2259 Transcript_14101/m.2259 type:complete len:92 (-) Transcript_14101:46-321(-)
MGMTKRRPLHCPAHLRISQHRMTSPYIPHLLQLFTVILVEGEPGVWTIAEVSLLQMESLECLILLKSLCHLDQSPVVFIGINLNSAIELSS